MNKLEITSLQNDLIKYCVKLQASAFRKKEKLILLDGIKSAEGAIEAGFDFEYLFVKNENDCNKFNSIKIKNLVIVNDAILKKISTTTSQSMLVGIIKEKKYQKDIFKNLKKIALIEDIKDPGNLGTIIRSAAAFAIDGIILFGNCVDIYNTKTMRACVSNMFKIPIIHTSDINFLESLKQNHQMIATVVNSKNNIVNFRPADSFIIAFGSEACGLSKEVINISDCNITIPMEKNVESLNLGVSASIIFAFFKFI